MQHRVVIKRHHPSLWAYFRQSWQVTIAFSEKLEGMVSLLLLIASAALGVITSLTAPEISDSLEPWSIRVAIGVAVFLVVQFLILAPIRMWRNAVWVVNVQEGINGLWDLHDEGVILLNEHVESKQSQPDEQAINQWVDCWIKKEEDWRARLNTALEDFAPAEARRLKNVVTFTKQLPGVNDLHTHHLNILRERLERLGKVIVLYHPALLPE